MDSRHGGDDSGTVGDGTTDDGSGGDGETGGDDGSTGDDGSVDDGGSGEDDGGADDSTGGDGGSDDGSGGGPGQDWAFELADFNVTASPDGEDVELAYTGESERDISGYLLYDGENGRTHPDRVHLARSHFPRGQSSRRVRQSVSTPVRARTATACSTGATR